MRSTFRLLALALGALLAFACPAGAAPDSLLKHLAGLGYTDLGVAMDGANLTVTFTNQTHRRLAVAIGEVLSILANKSSEWEKVRLIPQTERTPIGSVEVDWRAYRKWSSGAMTDAEFLNTVRIARRDTPTPERSASSWLMSDLGVYPGYSLSRGLSLGIQEAWRIGLADGMGFETRVQQTLSGSPMPGVTLASLNRVGWLTPTMSYASRIGYFGLDGWGGQFSIGVPFGPAEVRLIGGGATGTQPEAIARIYARPGCFNLGLRAGVGRYLDGDWGYEGSIIRWFDRSTLEGTVLRTSNGMDIRAVFTLHLGGPTRSRPGYLRIEPGTWPIAYQPERDDLGRTLLFTDDLEDFYQRLYQDEIAASLPTWSKN